MKWLKVFALFLVLSEYPDMQRWIENYAGDSRYRQIMIGTDKAMIGDLSDIKSIDSIFRVSFGRSNSSSLKRYDSLPVDERIFLSDGEFEPSGWNMITFP